MKYLEASLSESLPKLLCGHLQHQLKEAHIQCSKLKEKLKYEIQRFSTFVVNVRRSRTGAVEETDQALHDNEARVLKTSTDKLIQDLNVLKTKGQLIADLEQKNFEYWNTLERNLDKYDNLRDIKRILFNKNTYSRVLCSSDSLNQQKNSKLTELYRQLTEERKTNPTLRLIYLDFSYSSFPLQDMIILSSSDTDHMKIDSIEQSSLQVDVPQGFQISSSPLTSTDEIINILLLGETGTGKSTFINVFANYLTFNSLEQAQSNEPIVLIPVSFVVTVGDHFEEHTVQFGEFDSLNSENFNSIGQSVTQHCKSYVFDLHQFDGKKLRIIDTPGFGDTRGLNQDDQNMEHILQYINNLSHLNANCFLLKPNSSRLNMFFPACLTQLFSLLTPPARDNIIFCFTNARSTFYTPGDTGPLLKTMLASYSISDIPFQKDNTFCFDSGSFRYLVALQNEVPCDKEDKHEYERSWSISAKESNRLIAYINQKLFVYPIENEWQSIKRAQFEISHMIRPILETMRNILRNLILCENNLSNQFIELSSKPVWCSTTRCLTCKSDPEQVGTFWFIPTTPHEIQDYCRL
jgi:GTP-binding protein EngB required for normal cell division